MEGLAPPVFIQQEKGIAPPPSSSSPASSSFPESRGNPQDQRDMDKVAFVETSKPRGNTWLVSYMGGGWREGGVVRMRMGIRNAKEEGG